MMAGSNWKKFPTLFGLYIAQAIPMSFFSTVVPVIMRQENYSLESIGLLQLIKLPWIFKFLWAPLVDRSAGTLQNYRKWIISSELFYAVVILAIGFLDLRTDFVLIIGMMIVAFIASATQDIATDAFAILILKKEERCVGNSMQSAGSFMGTLAGSGLLLVVYHFLGWKSLLFALSGFVVMALIPLLLYRSARPAEIREKSRPASMMDIISFFRVPDMWKRVIMLTLFYSGIIGSLAMLKPYLVDNGYNIKEIGVISGIAGTSLAASAALFAGFLMKRISRRGAMLFFASFIVFVTIYLIVAMEINTRVSVISAILLVWISYGMATVGVFTTSMDIVRKGREGTDFTLQIVITHLSSLMIAVFSGRLADATGYGFLFRLEFLLALLSLVSVYFLFPRKPIEDEDKRRACPEV
jgi:predicted MFS family arabinose efflux permease